MRIASAASQAPDAPGISEGDACHGQRSRRTADAGGQAAGRSGAAEANRAQRSLLCSGYAFGSGNELSRYGSAASGKNCRAANGIANDPGSSGAAKIQVHDGLASPADRRARTTMAARAGAPGCEQNLKSIRSRHVKSCSNNSLLGQGVLNRFILIAQRAPKT